jgi:hypothetical protein
MLYLIVPLTLLVGIIWALVVFPSFRVVAVILVVLGVAAYSYLSKQAAQEQKQQEAKKAQEDAQQRATFEANQKAYCQAEQKRWAIVLASQIELRNPSLTQGQLYGVSNDDYTFTASAKNKSKSKVTAFRLNVTALDCPTQDARATDCDIVGHSDGTFEADIPPGEVRQISGKVTLTDMPKPSGVFSPMFTVKGVRAAIDQSDNADTVFFGELYGYKCN